MPEIRTAFHQELEDMERTLLGVADQAEQMVQKAVEAFTTGRLDLADEVIVADESIDETYIEIHNRWMQLMDQALDTAQLAMLDAIDARTHANELAKAASS